MTSHRRRAMLATGAMCLTAGLTAWAKPTERVAVVAKALKIDTAVPSSFGGWVIDHSIVPINPSPELQKVIAETYSQTLSRTYRDKSGYRIMLSMAVGDQVRGMDTHRPEICYPAQGFQLRRDTVVDDWEVRPGSVLPIRKLVAGSGPRNEPITYWLVVGDEVTAYGLRRRWATLKYGLTGRIPDGMLVRISSIDNDETHAFEQQQRFIQDMVENVSPEFRKRILGAL